MTFDNETHNESNVIIITRNGNNMIIIIRIIIQLLQLQSRRGVGWHAAMARNMLIDID